MGAGDFVLNSRETCDGSGSQAPDERYYGCAWCAPLRFRRDSPTTGLDRDQNERQVDIIRTVYSLTESLLVHSFVGLSRASSPSQKHTDDFYRKKKNSRSPHLVIPLEARVHSSDTIPRDTHNIYNARLLSFILSRCSVQFNVMLPPGFSRWIPFACNEA